MHNVPGNLLQSCNSYTLHVPCSLNATFDGYLPWTADVHTYSILDFVQVRISVRVHSILITECACMYIKCNSYPPVFSLKCRHSVLIKIYFFLYRILFEFIFEKIPLDQA